VSMPPITINAEAMQAIVAKAIIYNIPAEDQSALIESALRFLIEPLKDGYGSKRSSPLQNAFDQAVTKSAYAVVEKLVEEDLAIVERIRGLVHDQITKALAGEYAITEHIGAAIANVVARALRGDLQ
jgi:hypothetical protein